MEVFGYRKLIAYQKAKEVVKRNKHYTKKARAERCGLFLCVEILKLKMKKCKNNCVS